MKETCMQKELYDVVVVGAEIVGCSISYHLAKAGLKVALLGDSDTAYRSRKAYPRFEQSTSDTHVGRAASWIGRWIPAHRAKPECARIMDCRRALS
jgi:glycine/D-amino acid oxidase-like deaminating enzyme